MFRLLSQTTLRNILGTKTLHEILSDREEISGSMQVNVRGSLYFESQGTERMQEVNFVRDREGVAGCKALSCW